MQCTDAEITRDAPATACVRRECRLWLSAQIRKDRTMNRNRPAEPVVCPSCYEPLVEPHDLHRCKTIARAFALENAHMGNEISYQIMTLVYWLRDHPARPQGQGSSRRASACSARRQFLDHYIKLAQTQQ